MVLTNLESRSNLLNVQMYKCTNVQMFKCNMLASAIKLEYAIIVSFVGLTYKLYLKNLYFSITFYCTVYEVTFQFQTSVALIISHFKYIYILCL